MIVPAFAVIDRNESNLCSKVVVSPRLKLDSHASCLLLFAAIFCNLYTSVAELHFHWPLSEYIVLYMAWQVRLDRVCS